MKNYIGTPTFDRCTIHLNNGRDFTIEADKGNRADAHRVKGVTLTPSIVKKSLRDFEKPAADDNSADGGAIHGKSPKAKKITDWRLKHSDLKHGGTLLFRPY